MTVGTALNARAALANMAECPEGDATRKATDRTIMSLLMICSSEGLIAPRHDSLAELEGLIWNAIREAN